MIRRLPPGAMEVVVDPDDRVVIEPFAQILDLHRSELVFMCVTSGLTSLDATPCTADEVAWYRAQAARRSIDPLVFFPGNDMLTHIQSVIEHTPLSPRCYVSIACRRGVPMRFTRDQINDARQHGRVRRVG